MKQLKKTVLFTLALGTDLDIVASAPFEFTYELLYLLVPYERVSVRGAVTGLRDESLVSVYQRDKQTRIVLTSIGREALRDMFPGLKTISGRRDRLWTICLFLDVVKDVHISKKTKSSIQIFRPLREALLSHGFYALERGMYVLPRSLSPEFIQELTQKKAISRVLIFETRRMVVGDERQIIRTLFNIGSIASLQRSIAKTLDAIEKRGKKEKLHPQTKESLILLLPKLMDFFAEDLTTPDLYFPQEILLSDTKTLFFQVFAGILPKLLLN